MEEQFEKKSLNYIQYTDTPEDQLREELHAWLADAYHRGICVPVSPRNFANILVDNRTRLYTLYSNAVEQLANFMYHVRRIGGTCTVQTENTDDLFSDMNDTVLVLVKTMDFSREEVYTVLRIRKSDLDFFNTTLAHGSHSQIMHHVMNFMDSPLIKCNMANPGDYMYGNIMEYVSRFSGASWFENVKKQTVLVAGIGGIGSWVSMLLSRMQPSNIILYDDDVVETANMSGQLYSKQNVGMSKVTAMADNIYSFSNYSAVVEKNERFRRESSSCDIMISGFDNMGSRKMFFEAWKKHVMSKPEEERHKCLLIDGRLAAETFQVYCISGDDDASMTKYENEALFDGAQADNTVCSYKQTSYMANMIGGIIVNLFTNFCANIAAEAPIRTLPYYVEYEGALMNFKTAMP